MEWPIQEVAKHAGTTSRTLRHCGAIGLLPATRVGPNGYRYYDEAALVRLQRILLLRDLGLGLPAIAEALAADDRAERRTTDSLRTHLEWLRREQDRLELQIASVEGTINALEGGRPLMAEHMFDGFDHTKYQAEVETRWGSRAYADGDRWWRGMDEEGRRAWTERLARLNADWVDAASRGIDPAGDEAQRLARRHVEWLRSIPGTPAEDEGSLAAYVTGLGEMYVADERFAANYGGVDGARFVRDALLASVGSAE
ncbi:MerR family transcriptional regulator [Plantibacter sp. Mn2098]|uniref:MerR family transcriptional regulator n=1 Tax=Plantibacter sp. Mn2098 TaxID=3395266 RepID=UPI003BC67C49